MRGWALSLVLVGALISASAVGQTRPGLLRVDEKVGSAEGWVISYNAEEGGCLASTKFSDDTTVWLGVFGQDKHFQIALTNPAWQSIEPGKQYPLQLSLIGAGRWKGTFVGLERSGEKGVVSPNLKQEFVAGVVRSAGVAVSIGQRTIAKLSLQGSPAAVDAMLQCLTEKVAVSSGRPSTPRPSSKGASSGTGFFITTQGHILTNNHVAGDCSRLRVQQPGGPTYDARLLASDSQNDLSVLLSDMKPQAVAPLRLDVKLGENVAVFGFPLTDLLASSGNFTVGYVSALAGLRDDTSNMQISAQVQPGNSGGPVLDRNGNVVGVVVAMLDSMAMLQVKNLVPQNVNFAIKAGTAKSFLDANGVRPTGAIKSAALETAEIAEVARSFTVKVLCDGK